MASSAVTGQSFARGTSSTRIGRGTHCPNFPLPETLCGILCLVGVQFYENGKLLLYIYISKAFLSCHQIVGYRWASTILGILATVMGVFPFLFYKFGPRIRQSSRYAQELARLGREERERLNFIEQCYSHQMHT
jgi:hypothetical protein